MSRSASRRNRKAAQQEIHRLGLDFREALLMSALVTAMALQYMRFEAFETEKAGLLLIIGGLLLGQTLIDLGQPASRLQARRLLKSPLSLLMLAWLLIGLLSTLLSLNPARSLWGSPFRGAGWLMTLVYTLIFWQGAQTGPDFRRKLLVILLMMALPIALFTYITNWNLDPNIDTLFTRPGSLVGNPVFLSSWLVMGLFLAAPDLLGWLRGLSRPYSRRALAAMAALGLLMILLLGTLLLARSRGALLGFAGGAGLMLLAMLARTHKKRAVTAVLAAGVLLGTGYLLLGLTLSSDQTDSGLSRLLRPTDPLRSGLWEGALTTLENVGQPLENGEMGLDPAAGLRLFTGYGPDTVDWLFTRFDKSSNIELVLRSTTFVDRFHNLIWDTWAMQGLLGLLVLGGIFQVGLLLALRGLHLFAWRQWWQWLLLQLVCILLMAWLVILVFGGAEGAGRPFSFLPLGIGAGMALGSLLWAASGAFRDIQHGPLQAGDFLPLSAAGILLAQWLDLQFSFMTVSTQPLLWLILGLLAAASLPMDRPEINTSRAIQDDFSPIAWLAAGACGLVIIQGLGQSLTGDVIKHQSATFLTLFSLLLVTALAAGLFAVLSKEAGGQSFDWGRFAAMAGLWLLFGLFKLLLMNGASNNIETVMGPGGSSSASALRPAFSLLAYSGLLAILLSIAQAVNAGWWPALQKPLALLLLPGLILGSWYYVRLYDAATLYKIGSTIAANAGSDVRALALADAIYSEAGKLSPGRGELDIQQLYVLGQWVFVSQTQSDQDEALARFEMLATELPADAPYIIHTRLWREFIARHEPIIKQLGLELPAPE